MTTRPRRRREESRPAGSAPVRTCVGCRRVRPQAELLRLVRDAEGFVEPDPRRRGGGRGAYLCRSESCVDEALRRGRWGHAFRAPAALRPETVERLRASIEAGREPELSSQSCDDGIYPAARVSGRPGASVEGGW